MMAHSRRLGIVLLLMVATATAQQSLPLQISLVAQPREGTTDYLTAKDFSLKQNGKTFQVALARPATDQRSAAKASVPTRMLVVLDPSLAAKPHSLVDALKELDQVWQLGWEVAIVRPDGFATPYLRNEAALQQALAASPTSQLPQSDGFGIEQIKQFDDFPGRRILLYIALPDATSHNNPPDPLKSIEFQARKELVQLYIVDGGSPAEVYAARTVGPGPEFGFSPQQSYSDGRAFHAINLHDAVVAAVHGARDYYLLTVKCIPGSCPNLQKPYLLAVHSDLFAGHVRYDRVGAAVAIQSTSKADLLTAPAFRGTQPLTNPTPH